MSFLFQRRRFFGLLLVLLGGLSFATAQENGDVGGGGAAPPQVASPEDGGEALGEGAPASNEDPTQEGDRVDNGFDADVAGSPANFDQVRIDLEDQGFRVPLQAFEIFPENVRQEIQTLVGQLLPLLAEGREKDLSLFFDAQGERIATVFDQLGLEQNSDALLALPSTDSIKFPNEFEDYAAYLDTLELEPFERDYMLQSHLIAEQYEQEIAQALADREKVQSALEDYKTRLEALNERYEEQFREQFLESLDRAGADGRRPDIDR